MELRKFPKGDQLINPIGIGLGAFTDQSEDEIESIVRKAIDNGINFFDMCGGTNSVYRPFGKAIKGKRELPHEVKMSKRMKRGEFDR